MILADKLPLNEGVARRAGRTLAALIISLALALVLAGCGSSGAENESAGADGASTPLVGALVDDDGDHDDEDGDHDDEDGDHDDEDGDHDGEDGDHDDGSSGLGAHEHGTAEMSVAWIDAEVTIELISPTINVFGFEYEPTTEEDLAVEADRTESLSAPGIMAINAEAGCALTDPVETEVEREGSHSEITVSWRFECGDADAVRELDTSELFAQFPSFEDIDVQWISESEQSAAELSPSATTLSLRQ